MKRLGHPKEEESASLVTFKRIIRSIVSKEGRTQGHRAGVFEVAVCNSSKCSEFGVVQGIKCLECLSNQLSFCKLALYLEGVLRTVRSTDYRFSPSRHLSRPSGRLRSL